MKRKTLISENINRILIFLILFSTTITVSGQGLPVESPEKNGISSERLNRIDAAMNNFVQNGKMPGMVAMVVRHG